MTASGFSTNSSSVVTSRGAAAVAFGGGDSGIVGTFVIVGILLAKGDSFGPYVFSVFFIDHSTSSGHTSIAVFSSGLGEKSPDAKKKRKRKRENTAHQKLNSPRGALF